MISIAFGLPQVCIVHDLMPQAFFVAAALDFVVLRRSCQLESGQLISAPPHQQVLVASMFVQFGSAGPSWATYLQAAALSGPFPLAVSESLHARQGGHLECCLLLLSAGADLAAGEAPPASAAAAAIAMAAGRDHDAAALDAALAELSERLGRQRAGAGGVEESVRRHAGSLRWVCVPKGG